MSDATAADRNEAVVRRVFDDVMNKHDLAAAEEICANDSVIHVPGMELPHGPEGLKAFARSLHEGFPDLRVVIDAVIAAGDTVAVRWHTDRQTHTGPYRGIPPTGRVVAVTGNNVYRLAGGRVEEAWIEVDSLGLAQQLGVVPSDGLGSGARIRFILGSLVRLAYLQAKYSIGARRRGSPRS